jgi:hypothetical protein
VTTRGFGWVSMMAGVARVTLHDFTIHACALRGSTRFAASGSYRPALRRDKRRRDTPAGCPSLYNAYGPEPPTRALPTTSRRSRDPPGGPPQ